MIPISNKQNTMPMQLQFIKELIWYNRHVAVYECNENITRDECNIGIFVANENTLHNEWAVVCNYNIDTYSAIEDLLGMTFKMTRFQYKSQYSSIQYPSPSLSKLNRRLSCACLNANNQMSNDRRMSRIFEWSIMSNTLQVFEQQQMSGHEINNLTKQSAFLRRMCNSEYQSDMYNECLKKLQAFNTSNKILSHFRLCSIDTLLGQNIT